MWASSASLANMSGRHDGNGDDTLTPIQRAVVQLRVAAGGDRAIMEAAVTNAESIAAEALNRPHMVTGVGTPRSGIEAGVEAPSPMLDDSTRSVLGSTERVGADSQVQSGSSSNLFA